jgi:hypothetical protein
MHAPPRLLLAISLLAATAHGASSWYQNIKARGSAQDWADLCRRIYFGTTQGRICTLPLCGAELPSTSSPRTLRLAIPSHNESRTKSPCEE